MIVLVVNGDRYLINEQSKAADEVCHSIIKRYPPDAEIYFNDVNYEDTKRNL